MKKAEWANAVKALADIEDFKLPTLPNKGYDKMFDRGLTPVQAVASLISAAKESPQDTAVKYEKALADLQKTYKRMDDQGYPADVLAGYQKLIKKTEAELKKALKKVSASDAQIEKIISAASSVRRSPKKIVKIMDAESAKLVFKKKPSEDEQSRIVKVVKSWNSKRHGKAARQRLQKNERFYNKWAKKPTFDEDFWSKLEKDLNDIANYRLNY